MAIVTIGNIPVYDAILTDAETGMMKISLVDDPAVMSNFQAFDNTKKMQMYSVTDEEKRIVRGVVMRADFPIYRRDDSMGEYYIIYKADTIREMAEKYLLEGRQNNVNLMHQDGTDTDGVQMVQYFIKDTANGVNPAGYEEISDGSLFAEFHIVDDTIWNAVKDGTYKGFSLEGVFSLTPETDKEKVTEIVDTLEGKFKKFFNRLNNMSKLSKFKEALARVLAEFANLTTDKGILVWDGDDDLKVGDAVFVENAEGERTDAEDGEYKTDTQVIVVADGKVSEIKDAEAEPKEETPAEENMAAVETPAEENTEVVEETPAETPAETPVNAKKEAFAKIVAAFKESYNDKWNKIADAIYNAGFYGWLYDCGDEFAILDCYDEFKGEEHLYEFAITWDAEGNPIVGDYKEVVRGFIPVDKPKEETPSQEAFNALQAENESLKAKVEELSKMSAAKPAHEEVKTSAKLEKTGNKGLDRLVDLMNA